jgi:hypothetical protein
MTDLVYVGSWRLVWGALALTAVCGCTSMEVRSAYGPGVNYERFGSTFAWQPRTTGADEDQHVKNPTFDEFLRSTITRGFQSRGYVLETGGAPDFLIDYAVVHKMKGGLRNSSWSAAYEEGTLIINIFNAKGGKYVWRGYATARLDEAAAPATQKQRITEAVRLILERFPKEGTQ